MVSKKELQKGEKGRERIKREKREEKKKMKEIHFLSPFICTHFTD